MSNLKLEYPPGATPLDPDEKAGLIPTYITTQGQLNEVERENILKATEWALGKATHQCLNVTFCLDLHKRMFSDVWKWAGKTRQSEKSIGIPKSQIYPQLKQLFDNTKYLIDSDEDNFVEIAARFHHKLVSIHAFPNGNGRHARLMTEVIQTVNGKDLFTWGSSDLYRGESNARKDYIAALRAADGGNFEPLIKFVRT